MRLRLGLFALVSFVVSIFALIAPRFGRIGVPSVPRQAPAWPGR